MPVRRPGKPDRRPDQPQGPLGEPDRLHRSGDRKEYKLRQARGASVRPRGWHLMEEHLTVDGSRSRLALRLRPLFVRLRQGRRAPAAPISTCRRWRAISRRSSGTTFSSMRRGLGLPKGTIKATVLIETLPAAFEMDEILYELRDHIAGLNCGRWDYIFSFIKRSEEQALPHAGPSAMVMGKAFLRRLFAPGDQDLPPARRIRDGRHGCADPGEGRPGHERGRLRESAADKEREAGDGHDGTWVAHPDLVPVAMEVFDRLMPGQPARKKREDVPSPATSSWRSIPGRGRRRASREHPRRRAIHRGLAARPGRGAALQPDGGCGDRRDFAAQVWQWLYHGADLDDGRIVTPALFRQVMDDEMKRVRSGRPTSLRRGALLRGGEALRRHVAGEGVRGVPDPSGLRLLD